MTDAASEIKKMWDIVAVGPDSVIELRPIWPKGVPGQKFEKTKHFRAASHTSVGKCREAFERAALELNRQGFNIYTVMNPIRSDFSGPGAAKDSDIVYRDLLLIDIDRKGDTSVPANQAELEAAQALACTVRAAMAERESSEPIVVMSGNGYHLYYVLEDVGNTPDAEAMVKGALTSLASSFNNEIVGVDTTVYNASRITKVPGTIMRKGIATEDRPYRMAVVCDDC
jgi:hypothetical protein